MEIQWDTEYDTVVVGSGGAGFSAALTAKKEGLSVLLIEKTDKYGGSTALSGGAIWVPNNVYLKEAGVNDTLENAQKYLNSTVGNRTPQSLQNAYLTRGPEMVKYLRDSTDVQWVYIKGYSDYYPNRAGSKPEGRSIEAKIFNLKKLKADRKDLRRSEMPTMGMVLNASDFHNVNMFTRTWAGMRAAIKVGFRFIRKALTPYSPSSLGEALIGRLRLSYKKVGGELWLSAPYKELIQDKDGRVIGIKVLKEKKLLNIKTNKGVIFGSGGFSHSQELREKYLPHPTKSEWSLASEGQTGDFIIEAEKLGASLDLMERVWGTPSCDLPTASTYMPVAERALPSIIIVNNEGKRFQNECTPYQEFVDNMYKYNAQKGSNSTIPSWYIFDKKAKSRYLIYGIMPGLRIPKKWFDTGFVKKANSIEDLAKEIDVPASNLVSTINNFNESVKKGADSEFHRGENAYDKFYGDPTLKTPNLYKLGKAPFYALALYPGDIGTKGGTKIDLHSRVLNSKGNPIPGLYAAGNTSASVMGETYPGAGATIGPAMVFGYIAAMHMVGK